MRETAVPQQSVGDLSSSILDASSSDASSPVEDPSILQRRRQYFREKQRKHRQHRRKDKDEIASLRRELADLQLQVHERTRHTRTTTTDVTLPLSWEVVSSVFRHHSSLSLAEQKDLLAQVVANKVTLADIQSFVASCVQVPRVMSWGQLYRKATLPAAPEGRLRAKEWLTLQMYYNMDRLWQQFPPVGATDVFQHPDIQFDGPCINFVGHEQLLLPFPLHGVASVLRHRLNAVWQFAPDTLTVERESNTAYYRHTGSSIDPTWNLLVAHFTEANRCVMVLRRVQADDAAATDAAARPRTAYALEWKDLRRVSATETSMRTLCVVSQRAINEHFLSLDQVARANGWDDLDELVTPSEEAKRETLRALLLSKVMQADARNGERFLEALTSNAMEEEPSSVHVAPSSGP
ncbi:Aste57867_23797 [Aphanomyces stellatus]|uniref:Aste57867_23797 protein n=1 Tax=Aphanomyces stellatus TaxID=120398 RepID=A0A485LT48_9STRA|nr:hypothetical protein As57867_023724 [Aphanomyces stellatus]VFU00442.1 Aste57867_23797 [Aphanomyces stellatus]